MDLEEPVSKFREELQDNLLPPFNLLLQQGVGIWAALAVHPMCCRSMAIGQSCSDIHQPCREYLRLS